MAMKRSCRENEEIEGLVMAKCLMLLSSGLETKSTITTSTCRVFECRTCNRWFPSFQALGGHRASHKKPRLNGEDTTDETKLIHITKMKPKRTHYLCSICGLHFNTGQALGGHMRTHRAVLMKKGSNSNKVLCLDLNLTPLENDLKLLFGKLAPMQG